MIDIQSYTTKKHQQTLFRPLTFKVEENSRTSSLQRNLRNFQGKMEYFKAF